MVSYIKGIIDSTKLTDLVDMTVIAAFIYIILVWLKKARARFMFIGMIIMGSIYLIARVFGLYLTTMALQAFFAVALIMIVIIFQDDFSRFFENLAIRGVIHRRRLAASFSQNVEILSAALANLSRKKIGALVAVRGKDPLDRHLEAGIGLDGVLSQVLLESIFDRHVPSHDGAVIVEGVRITKFGCYLPLSTNIQEVGRLGTRHAAALGLAERADALCLIVSEEQGTISVAEDGRIRQLRDIGHLQKIMEDFYRKKFPRKKRIAFFNLLTQHFLEKVVAIVLACGLWLAFGHRTETVRRDFLIPVEYRNLASNVIIKEQNPKEVTVTLSGSGQAFNLLKAKELKLSLDMTGLGDGENSFPLTKDLIGSTSGLSVVSMEPDAIRLYAYRVIPLTIPVEMETKGRSPSGVTIREIKVEPKEVSVIVPSTVPRSQLTIVTEPIDLKTITETITLSPKLVIAPDIRFADDKPPDVKVIIEVEKKEDAAKTQ